MADESTVRLAHFSDIHVSAKPLGWRLRDLLSKRTTGWMNQKLGRGRRFRHAEPIVAAMMADIRQRDCQHVVFSGDATALGFESEMKAAARCLGLGEPSGVSRRVLAGDDITRRLTPLGSPGIAGIAVPGNHDYYTPSAVRSASFEHYFAKWQWGERVGPEVYPFAQNVGHCWLIGVNSARSNFLVWDARGGVGAAQLERLRVLLTGLSPGPRILVTHYPLYLEDGQPEHRWRRLRDDATLFEIAKTGQIALWLHGHRHTGYLIEPSGGLPFPIICAGSATQEGKWSWNEYLIQGTRLTMIRRTWNPQKEQFDISQQRELQLPG